MNQARRLSLDTLRLEQDGRVLTATYADPPHNLVTTKFIRELDLLTAAVDRDRSVGAVVLTGGVDRRFLTHADVGVIGGMVKLPHPTMPMRLLEQPLRAVNLALRIPGAQRLAERYGGGLGEGVAWGHRWMRSILRMNRSSAVYVAAMNGPAMGGGFEIALACDLRIAADADYMRIGQIETMLNVIPGGGGTQRLSRMIGTAAALEHILESEPLGAAQALELGLVNRLVEPERLLAEAQTTAARLARRSPTVVGAVKRSVYFGASRTFRRGLDMEVSGFTAAAMTKPMRATVEALDQDVERLGDSPFVGDFASWRDGTRVDQVG